MHSRFQGVELSREVIPDLSRMEATFLNLEITGNEDEVPPKNAREERIRRAFEKSKATYKDELVYLSPGVS